jgi:hypothetical protein
MDLVYGRTLRPEMEGKAFRNARFFTAPEEKASTVYLDGDYPQVENAYLSKGVKVLHLDAALPSSAVFHQRPAGDVTEEKVFIPADWRELPWSQRDERGYSLRSLASEVSAGPVINKDEAFAAIEAYLAGETADDR